MTAEPGQYDDWADNQAGDTLRLRTAALHRVAHENDRLRAALSRVRALTFVSDDGGEYAHNPGCGGEYNCPACWADDIRQAIA